MEELTKLLLGIGLGLVVLVIALSFGADVTDDIDNDFTANSFAANISRDGQQGLGNLAAKAPTIGTVAAIVVILLLVVRVAVVTRTT